MVKSIIKSNRGSTLIMVIFLLTLFTTLGVTLLTLTASAMKMRVAERNSAISFYMSESGLDQAYGIVGKEVRNAIEAGKAYIDETVADDEGNLIPKAERFIQLERKKESDGLYNPSLAYNSPYITDNEDGSVNPTGIVDEDQLSSKIDEWFKYGYIRYLNKVTLESGILDLIVKLDNVTEEDTYTDGGTALAKYGPLVSGSSVPAIGVRTGGNYPVGQNLSTIDGFTFSPTDYDDKAFSTLPEDQLDITEDHITFTLNSAYTHNGIPKQIELDFSIGIPEHNQEYSIETEILVSLEKNALYSKGLVADKNVYVLGDDVTVNGDLYARGSTDAAGHNGIIIGNDGKSGKLTVNGRTITSGYLKTGADNSELTLIGNVYCHTLEIPETVTGGKIQVGSATDSQKKAYVYTKNDIALNGMTSRIDIYGSYFGFMSATDSEDLRSSIVIDKFNDLGIGTFLNITDEAVTKDSYFADLDPKPTGSIIAGTGYIDEITEIYEDASYPIIYQTGESVSVKQNYNAYNELLTFVTPTPALIETGDDTLFHSDNTYSKLLGSTTLALGFKNPDGTLNRYFNNQSNDDVVDSKPPYRYYKGVLDKRKYFYYAGYQNSARIRTAGINIANPYHITGAYISNGAPRITPLLSIAGIQDKLEKEYNYYTDTIADPQVSNYITDTLTTRTAEDLFSFDDADASSVMSQNTADTAADSEMNNANAILYLNTDAAKDLFLYESAGDGTNPVASEANVLAMLQPGHMLQNIYKIDKNLNTRYNSGSPLSGIIITRGDVYLAGKLKYRGTIITTGNIYILDDNKKVITNDYAELNITPDNNYVLNMVNQHEKQPGDQLCDLFRKEGTNMISFASTAVRTSSDPNYINFKEIINLSRWKKIQ